MPETTFTVLIKEARYLKATSFLTKQDPYARIWTSSSKNAKLNTKVVNNGGKNAKWEETFTVVVVDDRVESFFLEVMNKNDLTFDKVIGRAKFACSDISVTPAEVKCPLRIKIVFEDFQSVITDFDM
jgi:Ca2+-dependent lipid-binding protein